MEDMCFLMFESSLMLKCTRVHVAVMCSFVASLFISSCMIVPRNFRCKEKSDEH